MRLSMYQEVLWLQERVVVFAVLVFESVECGTVSRWRSLPRVA